jgi:hypothetical protein
MSRIIRPAIPPESVRSNSYPQREQLRELGQACIDYDVSKKTGLILARLANMTPKVRLAVNLKVVVGLMIGRPIHNVLTEGLTPSEHAALVELDMRGLPLSARETAHGLMNVHERWCVMRDLRKLFSKAARAGDAYLALDGDDPSDEEE